MISTHIKASEVDDKKYLGRGIVKDGTFLSLSYSVLIVSGNYYFCNLSACIFRGRCFYWTFLFQTVRIFFLYFVYIDTRHFPWFK